MAIGKYSDYGLRGLHGLKADEWYRNIVIQELDEEYICLQDAADILGISREKLAKIARTEEIGKLLDSTICNNKRWITRKSFELFLNAQNTYRIVSNEDKSGKNYIR